MFSRTAPLMPSTVVRPYQTVLQCIAAVWLIVAVAMVVGYSVAGRSASGEHEPTASPNIRTDDLLIIAGISGLIAIAATVPGWTVSIPENRVPEPDISAEVPPEPTENAELSPHAIAVERLGHAFLAGMLIRITGTVALFLASSYYMDASPTQIGIWVLGWHLVLLLTEVIALSRQIRVS